MQCTRDLFCNLILCLINLNLCGITTSPIYYGLICIHFFDIKILNDLFGINKYCVVQTTSLRLFNELLVESTTENLQVSQNDSQCRASDICGFYLRKFTYLHNIFTTAKMTIKISTITNPSKPSATIPSNNQHHNRIGFAPHRRRNRKTFVAEPRKAQFICDTLDTRPHKHTYTQPSCLLQPHPKP